MNAILAKLKNNPHTTGAAGVIVLANAASALGKVWLPDHAAQFDQTARIIERAAIMYGLALAGDAGAKPEPPKA